MSVLFSFDDVSLSRPGAPRYGGRHVSLKPKKGELP